MSGAMGPMMGAGQGALAGGSVAGPYGALAGGVLGGLSSLLQGSGGQQQPSAPTPQLSQGQGMPQMMSGMGQNLGPMGQMGMGQQTGGSLAGNMMSGLPPQLMQMIMGMMGGGMR